MAKIIKIEEDIVLIGTEDGGIKEVRLCDLSFEPELNDDVEIFETEKKVLISKKETEKEENKKININVSNINNTPPVYIANNTKAVNKIVYCVLALFLGCIGIHKFYAGKTSAGILYLLFSWTCIPAFIAFIELIIALCKKADLNGNILV